MKQYDLIVIGGGPGGYVAAIRASQLGMKVALLEQENLGGVCLNWGCIPTKALLKTAELYNSLGHLDDFGISLNSEASIDMKKVIARSRKVAKQLADGVSHLLKKNKITVVKSRAQLGNKTDGKHVVKTDKDECLWSPKVIIATGARPKELPNLQSNGSTILNYKGALKLDIAPKSITIVGSGAIGMEFASFYNDLGVQVTVIEMLNQILPNEDLEISNLACSIFENRGIKIIKGAKVLSANKNSNGLEVIYKQNDETSKFVTEKIITAVGITGNVEDLGLEKTQVKIEKGHIITNGFMETGENGIYAIGDVAGAPWLAHKASHEAVICVENLNTTYATDIVKKISIPSCTYCRPQIASIGLTEAEAKEINESVRIGTFPFLANGKAIAVGEPTGMIKTIFCDKTGALLGAHMIGPEVTELIQGFAIAIKLETTEMELMETIFAHPTLSEAMHEAVLDSFGRALHF